MKGMRAMKAMKAVKAMRFRGMVGLLLLRVQAGLGFRAVGLDFSVCERAWRWLLLISLPGALLAVSGGLSTCRRRPRVQRLSPTRDHWDHVSGSSWSSEIGPSMI